MKRARARAEAERLAEVRLRKWVRRIPDNAKLTNILLQMDRPMREHFYRKAKPYLKFEPLPLETINGLQG